MNHAQGPGTRCTSLRPKRDAEINRPRPELGKLSFASYTCLELLLGAAVWGTCLERKRASSAGGNAGSERPSARSSEALRPRARQTVFHLEHLGLPLLPLGVELQSQLSCDLRHAGPHGEDCCSYCTSQTWAPRGWGFYCGSLILFHNIGVGPFARGLNRALVVEPQVIISKIRNGILAQAARPNLALARGVSKVSRGLRRNCTCECTCFCGPA